MRVEECRRVEKYCGRASWIDQLFVPVMRWAVERELVLLNDLVTSGYCRLRGWQDRQFGEEMGEVAVTVGAPSGMRSTEGV